MKFDRKWDLVSNSKGEKGGLTLLRYKNPFFFFSSGVGHFCWRKFSRVGALVEKKKVVVLSVLGSEKTYRSLALTIGSLEEES